MKRTAILSLTLIAIFALGALAPASGFAENPEILPVPTTTTPLGFTSESGSTKLVGTKEGNEVTCQKAKNKGSFTSQDAGKVDITFEECKAKGMNCTSPGESPGVILTEGEIQLVDILPTATLDLGIWLKPAQDGNMNAMLTFKCGPVIEFIILGSVIGSIDNAASELLLPNTKTKELKGLWKETTRGEQQIKECMMLKALCELNGAAILFLLEIEEGKGHELAAEIADATFKFEHEIEVHF